MELSTRAVVLNAVVTRGTSSGSALAAATLVDPSILGVELARLIQDGSIMRREGPFAGYLPTSKGVQQHQALLDSELGVTDSALAVLTFQRFEPLNAEFKVLCTDVQAAEEKGASANFSHAGKRLYSLHSKTRLFIEDMSQFAPRWRLYDSRLNQAFENITAGDWGLLTRPLSESHHDIWMELHQDIIVTLGLQRGEGDF